MRILWSFEEIFHEYKSLQYKSYDSCLDIVQSKMSFQCCQPKFLSVNCVLKKIQSVYSPIFQELFIFPSLEVTYLLLLIFLQYYFEFEHLLYTRYFFPSIKTLIYNFIINIISVNKTVV